MNLKELREEWKLKRKKPGEKEILYLSDDGNLIKRIIIKPKKEKNK